MLVLLFFLSFFVLRFTKSASRTAKTRIRKPREMQLEGRTAIVEMTAPALHRQPTWQMRNAGCQLVAEDFTFCSQRHGPIKTFNLLQVNFDAYSLCIKQQIL